jgi:glycosidase
MGFWLELGLDGFRVDAVPFFLETMGEDASKLPDPHEVLRDLRRFLGRRSGDGILLGEVNLQYRDQLEFFGGSGGDELTLMFDFIGMQNLYLSLARQDAGPLAKALAGRPAINPDNQWATFVRNHDELTLDKLSDQERQEVFAAFGPQERMQVYGRGLKRRLPSMLGGDPRQLRMVYSLLFSLPGTPVLYYGEEIGMGEDLDAPGRLAVRTPMQWTDGPSAGFSQAPEAKLISPLVDGGFGPKHVNAAQAKRDPDSLWNFIAMLIRRYRECPELGWGRFEVLRQPVKAVLAHRCSWEEACLVLLHNLGPEPATVPLDLGGGDQGATGGAGTVMLDLLGGDDVELSADGTCELVLPGYGYRWLRVLSPGDRRLP